VAVSSNQSKHESTNPVQQRLISRFHAEVVRFVGVVDPVRILEVGCGEGFVLSALAEAGVQAELVGFDLDEGAVAAARQRLGDTAEIIQADVNDAPDVAGRFGIVMMLEVLEHLPDTPAAMDMLEKLAGPGGHLLLSVPNEPLFRGLNLLRLKNVGRWGSDPDHCQHWTSRAFARLVGERFEIVAKGSAFPWTMLLVRVPLAAS